MKRIVTGVNDEGKSYIVSNDELDESEAQPVWEYDPADIAGLIAAIDPAVAAEWIEPGPGKVRWYFAPLPPGGYQQDEPLPGMDEAGFHTTRTIDFDLVLEGEITLLLDEESVVLQRWDYVIQQATRHAWRNDGETTAVLLALIHQPA